MLRDHIDSWDKPQLMPLGFSLAENKAMTQGIFEPIEIALVRKLLNEVDIFFLMLSLTLVIAVVMHYR